MSEGMYYTTDRYRAMEAEVERLREAKSLTGICSKCTKLAEENERLKMERHTYRSTIFLHIAWLESRKRGSDNWHQLVSDENLNEQIDKLREVV